MVRQRASILSFLLQPAILPYSRSARAVVTRDLSLKANALRLFLHRDFTWPALARPVAADASTKAFEKKRWDRSWP